MTASDFHNHLASLPNDTTALAEFQTTVKSADDLVSYANRNGFELSRAQATELLDRAATARAELSQLSDTDLEQVTGGISWAQIGAIAGDIFAAGRSIAPHVVPMVDVDSIMKNLKVTVVPAVETTPAAGAPGGGVGG